MELPHKDKPSDFGIIKPKGAGKGSRISGFNQMGAAYQTARFFWRSKCCDAKVVTQDDNYLTCKACGNILRAEDINNN